MGISGWERWLDVRSWGLGGKKKERKNRKTGKLKRNKIFSHPHLTPNP